MVMTSASSFQLSLSRVWMHGAFTILCVLYENKEFVDDLLNSHSSSANAARSSLIEEIHDFNEQKPAFPPSFYTEPLLGLCSLPSISNVSLPRIQSQADISARWLVPIYHASLYTVQHAFHESGDEHTTIDQCLLCLRAFEALWCCAPDVIS